jgi:hypothetical protein
MSDIFISYKREEQPLARKLADALESEGWTVWWDPNLRAGEHFDEVIEKALNEARCVIVIWSKLSVQSRYVRNEATYALENGKLVPVAIETVDLPFRFKGVHTLSLLGWDGSRDFSQFRRLVDDIAAIVETDEENRRRNARPNPPWRAYGPVVAAVAVVLIIFSVFWWLNRLGPERPDNEPQKAAELQVPEVQMDPISEPLQTEPPLRKQPQKESSRQRGPALEYSRVVLASSQFWDSIPRDAPNYFLEREKSLERDNPAALRKLETLRKRGDFACPDMFADSGWCRKVAAFFAQKGLQEIAIDPRFDILVTNPVERPVTLHAIGVEVAYAEQVEVTLGRWETTRVAIDATHEISMPPFPTTWLAHEEIKEAINARSGAKPMTAQYLCLLLRLRGEECKWPNLPILVWATPGDPIYLRGGEPYRFEVVLRDYHRLPNNVVIRFVVGTNYGQVFSHYFYLLAM